MKRRNIQFPDDLWRRVLRAAAQEGAERGAPVTASEWIREAVEKKLQSTKERK